MTTCKYCSKKYHLRKKDEGTWHECYCSQQCHGCDMQENQFKEITMNAMEIEIITTKKKLTKAIVNQMRYPSKSIMETGKSLGLLIGVVKNCYKAILIRHEADYYVIPANFKKGDVSVHCKEGKWSRTKKFETTDDCDAWWKAYTSILKAATHQIYI